MARGSADLAVVTLLEAVGFEAIEAYSTRLILLDSARGRVGWGVICGSSLVDRSA